MIEITVDTEALVKRIDAMRHKIEHFKAVDIGAELSEWQTHDMHRHRPFTMRSRRAGKAATKIRPHSLFEMKRSLAAQRRFMRRARHGQIIPEPYRHWSTRPVLRAELFAQLGDRYAALLPEKLKW
jgi:hypothetical protein